jgi:hypothetical protein
MIYRLPTRYEEFTLLIKVKTSHPEKIHLIVSDESHKNTVFTNRWKTVNGELMYLAIRMVLMLIMIHYLK